MIADRKTTDRGGIIRVKWSLLAYDELVVFSGQASPRRMRHEDKAGKHPYLWMEFSLWKGLDCCKAGGEPFLGFGGFQDDLVEEVLGAGDKILFRFLI